jgi:hypothetical protein
MCVAKTNPENLDSARHDTVREAVWVRAALPAGEPDVWCFTREFPREKTATADRYI